VRRYVWAAAVVAVMTGSLVAQQGSAAQAPWTAAQFFATKPGELSAFATGGFGTNQNSDDKFFSLGAHLGKVLTPAVGPGWLRGQFEIGIEVMPLWQAYSPSVAAYLPPAIKPISNVGGEIGPFGGTFTGFSIVPANFRWDFTRGERWVPWIQGAGGLIYTTHKFPSPPGDTSVWNFSPQFGIGTHYFLKPKRSLDFSANAVHISSASLGDKNPGINASVQFTVGYTWWK